MKKWLAGMVTAAMLLGMTGCAAPVQKGILNPEKPVGITAWTYYNGAQMEAFEALVSEFNDTVGTELGIVVENSGQGGVNELADELLQATAGVVGAPELPELAMVYPETAFQLVKADALTDLDEYFTAAELEKYIPSFIAEGRLTENGPLHIFPVAKSTEVFLLSKTDWDFFATATDTPISQLETVEGVAEVAKKYFDWSGGKAFFGRDSLDNYMVIGAAQLGCKIAPKAGDTTFPIDRETLKILWDNYYRPIVQGHFAAKGKFRSDDLKTGAIIAYVGSTSSAGYFPDKITREDDSSYPIKAAVLPVPHFAASTEALAVQQGAGFSVLRSSKESEYASATFLKWLTQEEQNRAFSLGSSYMPVTLAANDPVKIKEVVGAENSIVQEVLMLSANLVKEGTLYAGVPFEGSNELRKVLRTSLENAVNRSLEELAASGKDRPAMMEKILSEECFDIWYQRLSESYAMILTKNK